MAAKGQFGLFDICYKGPEGEVTEQNIRRQKFRALADAYRGRIEPQCRTAYELNVWLLAQFPAETAKVGELRGFATRMGIDVGPEIVERGALWEAIFGETLPR